MGGQRCYFVGVEHLEVEGEHYARYSTLLVGGGVKYSTLSHHGLSLNLFHLPFDRKGAAFYLSRTHLKLFLFFQAPRGFCFFFKKNRHQIVCQMKWCLGTPSWKIFPVNKVQRFFEHSRSTTQLKWAQKCSVFLWREEKWNKNERIKTSFKKWTKIPFPQKIKLN